MEFIFLGTGPAEAIPRPGHSDPICRDALKPRSKSRRLRSSGLLRDAKSSILIDAGPDLGYQLAAHRVECIDAVFLTHAHLDAAGGLRSLNDWAGKHGARLPVYTERATERRYGKHPNLIYHFVRSGTVVRVGRLSVRCFRVRHSVQPGFPTMGFRVGKFAYASDAASVPSPSLKMLHGVRDLVLDAAFWFGTSFRGHMRPEQALRTARYLDVDRLILTQTGHTYPPHDEAESELRSFAKAHTPKMQVRIAYDGLHLKRLQ